MPSLGKGFSTASVVPQRQPIEEFHTLRFVKVDIPCGNEHSAALRERINSKNAGAAESLLRPAAFRYVDKDLELNVDVCHCRGR